MFICQLPTNIQESIRQDITTYINKELSDYSESEKKEMIETAMNEKLVNILDLSDSAIECGLSSAKYNKNLW